MSHRARGTTRSKMRLMRLNLQLTRISLDASVETRSETLDSEHFECRPRRPNENPGDRPRRFLSSYRDSSRMTENLPSGPQSLRSTSDSTWKAARFCVRRSGREKRFQLSWLARYSILSPLWLHRVGIGL